jgi:hypothetical protein
MPGKHRARKASRGILIVLAYLLSLTLYSILVRLVPESPLDMYLAALTAGLTGITVVGPLDAALAAGLGGLTGHLLVLALNGVPGYIAGLARVIGWTPVITGLLFSLATPAGVSVLVWHALRRPRAYSAQD